MSTSTSTPYTRTFCCDVQSWSEIDGHHHIVRRLVFLHHYSSSNVEQHPLGAVIYVFFIIANNQGDGQVMVLRQSIGPTSQSVAGRLCPSFIHLIFRPPPSNTTLWCFRELISRTGIIDSTSPPLVPPTYMLILTTPFPREWKTKITALAF